MTNDAQEKIDYSKTLNLPKTEFSMRAGLTTKEPFYLKQWQEEGLYTKIRERAKGKPTFILHDGPPYANGDIHMGHALNKILKDIIVKFKTMQGFDSYYLPGWDCHGLPIEHQLLTELKKQKSEFDCIEFRKKAHDYAMKYVDIQREEFKRLGIFGDWDNPYVTLDPDYEYWILKSLSQLNQKGFIYRGLKPVNWCYQCETALAEAEVEYEDHTSRSIFVKFEVSNPNVFEGLPDKKLSLLIWTTTPWTLIANVAVAVHPHFQYSLVDIGEEIIVVESSLVQSVLAKGGSNNFHLLKDVDGNELTKFIYHHPIFDKVNCRVVVADYVTKEDGTGLVHIAPGHGQDDYETGVANNLDIVMPVDDQGKYTEEAGEYAGQHVFKANDKIIENLKHKGILFGIEDIDHSYPHCWRCKKPIIFRATQQWFLRIDHNHLRERLIEAVKNDVRWVPPTGQERILSMLMSRPDWCLSRQRYWGVPIPAFICHGCGGDHKLFEEVLERFALIVKSEGSDAWFEKDIKNFIPDGFVCPDCGKSDFEKTMDILDVWFDSGVSHQAVVKGILKKDLPVDLYLEGSDQHRGWFQSSLILAIAIEDKPPYYGVLTHGFVVDGQGRKMSKSLGNVMSPLDIIKTSGSDILRLWVASSSYNEDIRISKEILDRLVDAYRKIRNTVRYLLSNIYDFDPDDCLDYGQLQDLDKWALYRLSQTISGAQKDYTDYEFAKVYKRIYTFCNEDLSSIYLDILKDRLYTSPKNSRARKSAQTVLFHTLNHLVRVMAPILSFTAEEIFKAMPRRNDVKDISSVHLLSFEDIPKSWINHAIEEQFRILFNLRPDVLKALEEKRSAGEIGSSLEAKVIFYTASDQDYQYFRAHQSMLPAAFIVSQVEINKVNDVEGGLSEEFAKTRVEINQADGEKCHRCWNYTTDIGRDQEHQSLCARCTANVKECLQ